ncbi:hypothetical protein HJC23_003373 [Cyclotella cryptica]|uniref:Leucine-rich repeat-containing N-terminal plant-type domain-containing protein n=1 Tax=Cyclotella cryptica TaxID=29204 RepID=A0ABD3QY45_9STRA|eukprot:CCRYP_000955-RB/>CCRYP_000955-RB protein AED:0.03 eAED:0.03 QI:285/1/0.75/1/0.66/0.5/4/0/877
MMSAPCHNSNEDGIDVDTSMSHDVANREVAIEQDLQCHTQEPNFSALVRDSSSRNMIGEEGRVEDIHNGFAANHSNAPNPSEEIEGRPIARHLNSQLAEVSCIHSFMDDAEATNMNIEAVGEGLGSEANELPPVPLSMLSHVLEDGWKSEKNAGIQLLGDADEECPQDSCGSYSAGKIMTEHAESVQSTGYASSIVQPPPQAESDPPNLDPASLNEEMMQDSGSLPTTANLNDSVIQGTSNLPRTGSNVLSPSVPNEHMREDEFLLPEAFPVEANAPPEYPNVGVAELVEPDQSRLSLKKNHACVVSSFLAAIFLALGLTITFTSSKTPSIEMASTPSTLTPTLQPTHFGSSSQPSLNIRNVIERNVLQRNVTFDQLEPTDGRIKALAWITEKDQMEFIMSKSSLFQRYVLGLLAFDFSILSWLSDINECGWTGVECDVEGHVIGLNLTAYGLDGTIPPEIGTLQHMQTLSLSDNSLYGTLPSELFEMKFVSEVHLDGNNFTSTLPFGIGNLKELIVLSLSDNKFTGPLPSELGNLKKLTHLYLDYNFFSGSLPSELFDSKDLTVLTLSGNEFTGTLQSKIRNLNKLAELRLDRNQFTGTFPSEVGSMSNLTHIILWFNQFSGALPTELGNLSMLHELDLDSNEFTGTLPSEIANALNLARLYLYSNKFTGTLPSELGNLKKMEIFFASQNQFTGTLPTEIGNWKDLFYVRFNENQFSGTLPTELGIFTKMIWLHLFSNQFSGTIPSELQNLTSLEAFSIYSNQLTGTLPSWIGHFNKLSTLYVGGNQLTGTLPSDLGLLSELQYFGVDSNNFTGTLPSWIGDLSYLRLLWVNDNQFTGTFPPEIENKLDLEDFCLSNNNFTGSVPAEIQTNWQCYS